MANGSRNGAPVARWWHGCTCAVATAALVLQFSLVIIGARVLLEGDVPPLPMRVARFFCYFTVQSNALGPLLHLTGASWWADLGLHVVVPILALTGWALFGPRPRVDRSSVGWALLWPITWLGCTLAVGALTTWHPYPFLNADSLGYPRVLLTSLVVTAVFLALIALVALVERLAPSASIRFEEKP